MSRYALIHSGAMAIPVGVYGLPPGHNGMPENGTLSSYSIVPVYLYRGLHDSDFWLSLNRFGATSCQAAEYLS